MKEITGKYNNAVVYTDFVDSGAEGLITALCNCPASEGSKIRIMPDVHAGKGCAVGTTITITDKVMPGLVGVDIGCGMAVYKVSGKKFELQKLDRIVHENIPSGMKIRQKYHRFAGETDIDRLRCLKHVRKDKALLSIGTLGGGNHFIEVDKDDDGSRWLIIHTGSRHLGVEVEKFYHDEAYKQTSGEVPYELAYLTGSSKEDYLFDMDIVQRFAETNRAAIADEIIKGMKLNVEMSLSTIHNYIDIEAGILRKGAVSAKKDENLIIPMNMKDGALLCVGKGNEDWNFSAPHGAGRLLSRQDTMQSFTLSQFKKEMKGIYSTSISKDTLDESPMAYKSAEQIMSQIGDTVEITQKLLPIYNFKAGREEN